ncbi:MAG: DUF4012 domain-containing protein, partial [Candidatus Falkowbacteria bacterium]|nr:DUF4012 domain-containing protein [Candidatus Falkowbacteria bacterium]
WHFWDANWWPNWPTSAEKMMWFYEKSDGPSVDGVISFTPTFFENLLKIIGPVDLPDYHLTISSDNFLDTIQAVVEKQPGKDDAAFINSDANKPKKIIGDLAQVVIEVLPKRLDKNKLIALIGTVEQSLKEKQVLFYFKDQLLQDKAVQYGWDGSIKNTAFDYLSVVNTNIAGQKTDKVIDQEITHDAQVDQSGKVIVTLKIKRIHNGKKGDIFTGVRNVDWLRVYVPLGSHLIEANGFRLPDQTYFEKSDRALAVDKDLINETNAEVDVSSGTKIYEESSKTVFANWSMIDPGESADIVFKYELPFKIYKDNSQEKEDRWSGLKKILKMEEIQLIPYTLLVQKQAGAKSVKFISNLTLPKSMSAVWRYPTGSLVNHSGWTINEDLNIDKYWAVLIQE